MKKNKNLKGFICMALALVMVLGSSFAYFTDRADTSASGTAGTVGVDLTSDINLLDEDGKDILNPGDIRDGSFGVENTGNKSIDVRTTIVLTSSVAMDKTAAQAEYELYLKDDVEFVEGKGWMPKDGAQPLEVRSISEDGKTITYNLPDYILNGNEDFGDDKREIEDGITTDSHDNDFVLIFKAGSSNEFQDSTVQLDVLVEAKQHRNTGAGWDIVAQESYTVGNLTQDAVLEAEDAGNIEVNPPADPDEGYAIFMYEGQEHRVKCESGTYEELWDYAQNLVGSSVTLNIVINDNNMLYDKDDAIATAFVQGAQIDIAILDLETPGVAVTCPVQVNIETSNQAAFEGVEVTATVYKNSQVIDTWTVVQGESHLVQGLTQWEMYDIKLTNNKTSDVATGFFEASNDDPIIVTIPYEIN